MGLVVLHPKHEHDAKSGAKSENAREHSGSREVETNLGKDKKRGILLLLTSVLFSLPNIITVNVNIIT